MAEPYYTTIAALRTALGVNDTALPDDQALELIQTAEDLIDEDLGARTIDLETGRKVLEDDVEPWQWTKLGRATVKLAAAIYTTPALANGQRWRSVSGPDFSFSGPLGPGRGPAIGALLNQTGLRRLTTTLRGGRRPAWYGFDRNVGDIDVPESGRWGRQ